MYSDAVFGLANALSAAGFHTLTDLAAGATDSGIDKVKEFLETTSGVSFVTSENAYATLTNDQLITIKDTIVSNRKQLSELLVEARQSEPAVERVVVSTDSARAVQADIIKSYVTADDASRRELWLSVNFIYVLALVFVVFTLIYLAGITFSAAIAADDRLRFIDQIIINLFSNLGLVTGFFFGNAYGKNSATSNPTYIR